MNFDMHACNHDRDTQTVSLTRALLLFSPVLLRQSSYRQPQRRNKQHASHASGTDMTTTFKPAHALPTRPKTGTRRG